MTPPDSCRWRKDQGLMSPGASFNVNVFSPSTPLGNTSLTSNKKRKRRRQVRMTAIMKIVRMTIMMMVRMTIMMMISTMTISTAVSQVEMMQLLAAESPAHKRRSSVTDLANLNMSGPFLDTTDPRLIEPAAADQVTDSVPPLNLQPAVQPP